MSFGSINNKYENRQYNYTSQKRAAEKRIHTQQQMMPIERGEEEETFQIGAQTFTIKEWKEFLDKFDSVQEVLEASMRERHAKQEKERLEKELEKKLEEALRFTQNRNFWKEYLNDEIKVSNFKEYETANYLFIPEPTIGKGGMRILKNGQSVAVFSVDDLKIRVDEQTGTRVLISEIPGLGNSWYDAIPVDTELERGLEEALGVENIPEVKLEGYYIGTHAETGIQYVMRPGDEGSGGKVLLRNEQDVAKYNALAEEYYNRYPNLVTSQEFGRIYASFEICGMMERTATGILRIGFDSVSYNDNTDYKKNWHVKFHEETWERLNEWLKENRQRMREWQEFSSWKEIFDEIGASYERIWSDEELEQGYLNS